MDTSPEHSLFPDWIALDTWELIDYQAANCRKLLPKAFQNISQCISQLLKWDWKICIEKAGEFIEPKLYNNNPRGAFSELKKWYRKVTGCTLRPTCKETKTFQTEHQ